MEWRYYRAQIVYLTGWTFEYIESLPYIEVMDLLAVKEGEARASKGR